MAFRNSLPKPVILVSDLNHYFGKGELRKQALFEINSGEIVIITKPSGLGETTLLAMMGALRSVKVVLRFRDIKR